MNLPTKNDVANAVKQTMQAEEKIDILEEQIWNLQDSFSLATQEQNKVLGEREERARSSSQIKVKENT
jgi:archaellum component FlaC